MPTPPDMRAGGQGPYPRRRRRALRAVLVPSLVALALLPSGAGAVQAPACSPFVFTQTYRGWGPADRYGRPVTVAYAGTQCTTATEGTVEVDITGTATTTQGDVFPFEAAASWTGGSTTWPPRWWGCSVEEADVEWTIPGLYAFEASALRGTWQLDVRTLGAGGRTTSWTYRAC